MKIITSIFITAMTALLASSVIAENSSPPGPYISINTDDESSLSKNNVIDSQSEDVNEYKASQQQHLNRGFQSPYTAEVPDWYKKRQAEVQEMMKQNNSRFQAEREMQRYQQAEIPPWVKQQQIQMEQRLKQFNMLPPRGRNNQPPPQWRQNQFPSMRPPARGQFVPNNKMYSPSATGPVVRPDVAPLGFNNAPGYRNSYPPVWR